MSGEPAIGDFGVIGDCQSAALVAVMALLNGAAFRILIARRFFAAFLIAKKAVTGRFSRRRRSPRTGAIFTTAMSWRRFSSVEPQRHG